MENRQTPDSKEEKSWVGGKLQEFLPTSPPINTKGPLDISTLRLCIIYQSSV